MTAFQYLNFSAKNTSDINKCVFSRYSDDNCPFENLYSSMKQFSTEPIHAITKLKRVINVEDGPMDFTVAKYNKLIDMVSDSIHVVIAL